MPTAGMGRGTARVSCSLLGMWCDALCRWPGRWRSRSTTDWNACSGLDPAPILISFDPPQLVPRAASTEWPCGARSRRRWRPPPRRSGRRPTPAVADDEQQRLRCPCSSSAVRRRRPPPPRSHWQQRQQRQCCSCRARLPRLWPLLPMAAPSGGAWPRPPRHRRRTPGAGSRRSGSTTRRRTRRWRRCRRCWRGWRTRWRTSRSTTRCVAWDGAVWLG